MLLTGGYGLMTCWGSVFTVALCLQVAGPFGGAGEGVGVGRLGPAHFPFAPPPFPSPRPLPLPQGSFSWTPYLAMACIFAFILSFGIGPGELGPRGLPPLGLAEGPGVSGRRMSGCT